MPSRFDEVVREISHECPTISYDDIGKIVFLTLERIVPREAAEDILKDATVNAMFKADREEALKILTAPNPIKS